MGTYQNLSRRSFVKGATALAVVGSAMAGASLAAADEAPALAFTPGTYTAEAQGRNGAVVVEVTVTEDAIVDAKVVEHRETNCIGTEALERIPAALVADQHMIDTLAGATLSSFAVREALIDCLTQAGGDVDAICAPVEYPVPEDASCDVLVVGGGGTGVAAAIELAEQGKSVILIEKEDILGGTTITASTYLGGWGTRAHIEQGIDAREDFKAQFSAGLEADPELLERYLDIVPDTLDTLSDYGADLTRIIDGKVQCGPANGGTIGAEIMPAAFKHLADTNVDVRTGHALTALQVADDGSVCGGEVTCKGGVYKIDAKAVFLASGSFIVNHDLVEKYIPEWAHLGCTWSIGNTGECLLMAEEVGAVLDNMSAALINPTGYAVGGSKVGMMSFSPFRYNGCILVGRSTGTRFYNELANYTDIAVAMPDAEGYAILDQAVMDSSVTIQEYFDLGYFVKGETVSELAELCGLDPDVLQETLDTYAGYAQSGVDEEFGRESMLSDLTTLPLYSAPVEPALHNHFGGVVTNVRGQALKADGEVLPGLWAGSGAADNRVTPYATQGCMIFARIIAQEIAAEIA